MSDCTKCRKGWKITVAACRLVLGAVFIFSGFVKSVDPWGTALKVGEYLSIYGFDNLRSIVMPFSIWLCGAELMMGLMLLFKVRIRLISIFALLSLLFFTILTLLSATIFPVEDCGCFGDAVKLSPWGTFLKNVVLLPMAFAVWWRYRPDRIFAFTRKELILTVLFFITSMGIGTYCYLHLPLIDYLPYKVGVNLHEAINNRQETTVGEVIVECRNLKTGEIREFALNDTEWQDQTTWDWLETRTEESGENVTVKPLIDEFAVRDAEGDATAETVTAEGVVYMLCITNLNDLSDDCAGRMGALVERAAAEGAKVVCLTPDRLQGVTYRNFAGSTPVRCYNIDATVMKTMLRARNGVVVLKNGTITDKRNCRDI